MPAHSSGSHLRETLQQLVRELDRDGVEVIIVESESSDDAWEIAEELAPGSWGFPARIFQSEMGLDAIYLKRASEAGSEVILLTADDLPFGVTGIRSWESAGDPSALVIDSKAHPGNVVPRSKLRAVMPWGYRSLRKVILNMTVGDHQGTLFVNRTQLQRHIPPLQEHGYLASTEIVHLAQVNRKHVVEVPAVLRAGHEHGGARIGIADVWDMTAGLVRPCRCRHAFRVALKGS